MELRTLKYFLAVCREGNMSRAAGVLHLTQPTLSRQISDLERELGCELLVRGRELELTEQGILLRRRASEIVQLAEQTESEVKSGNAVEGEVRIVAGETQGIRILASLIRAFQKDYPQVRFLMHSGNAEAATDRLDRGIADIAVFVDYSGITRYDHVRLKHTDAWCVLFPEGDALAEKDVVGPADIADLPLIASSQALERGTLSNWFGERRSALNVVAEYNLAFNAQMFVREGVGYVLALDGLTLTGQGTGLESRLLHPPIVSPIDIAWKRDQPRTQAVQKFIERLGEAERL